MNKILLVLALLAIFAFIDWYVYQGIAMLLKNSASWLRNGVKFAYWGLTTITFAVLITYNFGNPDWFKGQSRSFIYTGIFINYFSKLFAALFLFSDDLIRLGKWIASYFQKPETSGTGKPITRNEFLVKTAMVAGTIPFLSMSWGIISGAHDYRVRRKTLYLPNLPKAFDGIQIGQISDIHSGSFFNKTAVKGGVEMLMNEKPDVVFFTGDLVNDQTKEVKDYIDIFNKVKAPLGVFSTTGNHDYGEYRTWPSAQAKKQNFEDLKQAHKIMGYDLLMNEHRMIESGGEKLAVIGVENWGKGRFPKYGDLAKAHQGTEEAPVKLLLSHDPSHWDAQVRPLYPDIDLMFAGHTHGFQFGIEIGDFKWSPSQYAYKQWAGLYQEKQQHLYVNRGFGFIGYPGRVGMPPELTIITLKKA